MFMDAGEADIFLSYSSKNSGFAKKLRGKLESELQAATTKVWMDEKIRRGLYWRDQIDQALEAAAVVVLVVSPSSMKSAYVTYEWSYLLFMLSKEPYLLYFKECDKSTGMFGRLRDLQLPLNDCLAGDEKSSKLPDRIRDITELVGKLPEMKDAFKRLIDYKQDRAIRQAAALELGKTNRYLKARAYNYLLRGLKRQMSGEGRDGEVARSIADALAELGDKRAVASLYELYNDWC